MLSIIYNIFRFVGLMAEHAPFLGFVCLVSLAAFVFFIFALNVPLAAISLVIFLASGYYVYDAVSPFLAAHQAIDSSGNQNGPIN